MKFIVRFFALIGFLSVLCVVLSVLLLARFAGEFSPEPPTVPTQTVLFLDLDREITEGQGHNPFAQAFSHNQDIHDIVTAIDHAAVDDRVLGLYARLTSGEISLVHAQEIRDALARFRTKGKFTHIYADTYGEFVPGNVSYYLASSFEELWMQPDGMVALTGLSIGQPLFAGALDKIGLRAHYETRQEYKTAVESLTRREMSPANREMMTDIIHDWSGQIQAGIAENRQLGQADIEALERQGPLFAKDAQQAHLIDHVAYFDELYDHLENTSPEAVHLNLMSYYGRIGHEPAEVTAGRLTKMLLPDEQENNAEYADAARNNQGKTIALIYGQGPVYRGYQSQGFNRRANELASLSMSSAIFEAAKDERVGAIILRLDTPGGSAVASETVRRAMVRAREHYGKPVVVSMGEVAGSGGYWIAVGADRIVAEPGTLTGSIGVLAGKIIAADMFEKADIGYETISTGPLADMFSPDSDFTPVQERVLNRLLDDVYSRFTTLVAEARNLPLTQVQDIAKGRVYTGRRAKELGLVDELGGLVVAQASARELANLPVDARTVTYPLDLPPWQKLRQAIGGFGVSSHVALRVFATLERLDPVLSRFDPFFGTQAGPAQVPFDASAIQLR